MPRDTGPLARRLPPEIKAVGLGPRIGFDRGAVIAAGRPIRPRPGLPPASRVSLAKRADG